MSDGEDVLLTRLKVQGIEFMKSFADLAAKRQKIDDDEDMQSSITNASAIDDNEEEEWTGFASEDEFDFHVAEPPEKMLRGVAKCSTPEVVIFCEGTPMPGTLPTPKAVARGFMSSKVSKLKQPPEVKVNGEEEDDAHTEISNTHNDALLHRLVHTQLLSGSLNPELNLTTAQRRKALAGRVLELAGDSKLGKGENIVRQEERNKASKRVRDGIVAKQKEQDVKSLTEAKNMGNYHPALKRLFAASRSHQMPKRDRGLRMGIGRFSGGMLKLTPEEIGSVRDSPSRRGRGTSRSRGRR